MDTLLELAARNAVAAALLAGGVLLVSPLVRRPAVRNALWLIVLVRLVLPPIWSVPLLGVGADAPMRNPESTPVWNAEAGMRNPEAGTRNAEAVGAASEPAASASTASIPHSAFRIPHWLLLLWGTGAALVALLAVRRIRRFQRSLHDAVPAPAGAQAQALALAARLGLKHCPAVWLVPGRVPPLLWLPGLSARRARLIFPMELFFRLDADQRAALIAHELAHLRRRDPWVRWLELLTTALYWWHPLLGFIRRRLRESEEHCCDAWVAGRLADRKAYATALVETVIFLDGPERPSMPELASGASPVHDLKRRLASIMRGTIRGQLTRFGVLAMLGVAAAALAFGPAFSQDEPRDRKGPPPKKIERPKDGESGGPNRAEVEQARQELEQARHEAEKALQRLRTAEDHMRLLVRGPGGAGPKGPPPGFMPGPERQLQEMQKQLEEMKKMIEELRKEMHRDPNRPFKEMRPPLGDRRFPPGGPGGFPGRPFGGPRPDGEREKLPFPPEKPKASD